MRRTLRKRCEDRLRAVALGDAATIEDLVDVVARIRSRPVCLHAVDLPPGGPTGAWVATGQQDYLFYERRTSPRHQTQIIAHELGHMLFDHHSSPASLLAPLFTAP